MVNCPYSTLNVDMQSSEYDVLDQNIGFLHGNMLVVLLIVDVIEPLLFDLKHALATTPGELWRPDLAVTLHGKSIAFHMHRCDRSWQMANLLSDKLDIISHHLKSFPNHRVKRFSLSKLGLIHRQDYSDHSESHPLERIVALCSSLVKWHP